MLLAPAFQSTFPFAEGLCALTDRMRRSSASENLVAHFWDAHAKISADTTVPIDFIGMHDKRYADDI